MSKRPKRRTDFTWSCSRCGRSGDYHVPATEPGDRVFEEADRLHRIISPGCPGETEVQARKMEEGNTPGRPDDPHYRHETEALCEAVTVL